MARQFLEAYFRADFNTARAYAAADLYEFLDKGLALMAHLDKEEQEVVMEYISTLEIELGNRQTFAKDTVGLPFRIVFSDLPEQEWLHIKLCRDGTTWKVFALD